MSLLNLARVDHICLKNRHARTSGVVQACLLKRRIGPWSPCVQVSDVTSRVPALPELSPYLRCGGSSVRTHGHGSKAIPPVNIPIPTKIDYGWCAYPKMGSQTGFDDHCHTTPSPSWCDRQGMRNGMTPQKTIRSPWLPFWGNPLPVPGMVVPFAPKASFRGSLFIVLPHPNLRAKGSDGLGTTSQVFDFREGKCFRRNKRFVLVGKSSELQVVNSCGSILTIWLLQIWNSSVIQGVPTPC